MSDATRADAPPPFLDSSPPPWAARGLASILLVLFAIAVLGAFVVRVPETVAAPFVLAPIRGSDPIRAFRSGVVTAVRIAEGQPVAQRHQLFTIASTSIGDRSAERSSLTTGIRGAEDRLANRRERDASQRQVEDEERRTLEGRLESLSRTIEMRKAHLDAARERARRLNEGFERGLYSWMDASRVRSEADAIALDLERAEADHLETRRSIERLRHAAHAREAESREVTRGLLSELEQARIRKAALDEEGDYLRGTNQLAVLAPCSGIVLKLVVRSAGAIVREGEPLAEIDCGGDGLRAELTVPAVGAALVKPGQRVKLLYAAFPYQRYGVQTATIRWISPASDASGLRAFADLDDSKVSVDGQPRALVRGMDGRARVVVGRRTLVGYAFEPIRQLRENLSSTR